MGASQCLHLCCIFVCDSRQKGNAQLVYISPMFGWDGSAMASSCTGSLHRHVSVGDNVRI